MFAYNKWKILKKEKTEEYKDGVHCYGCYKITGELNKTQHYIYSEYYVFCVHCVDYCIDYAITRAF